MANKNNKARKSKAVRSQNTHIALLAPLMGVLGFVPLLVRFYQYDCGLEYFDFFSDVASYRTRYSTDLFLYKKMVWFIAFAFIMACIVVVKLINEKQKIKFSKIFIPLGVYGLLAFLSSIFSEYRKFSFSGIYEQFESVWALLGYVLVAYYAFLYINTEEDLKRVLIALLVSTVIMLLIGLSQAFFTDFFRTTLGRWLIMWPKYVDGMDSLTFSFDEGRVYLTLYNPNYVGSYASLLVPLFVMLAFAAEKLWMKILCGVISLGLVLALLGSQSRAGLVGIAAGIIMLLIVFNKKIFKNIYPVVLALVLIVGTIYTYDNYTNGAISSRVKAAFNLTEYREQSVSSIDTRDDYVVIHFEDKDLYMSFTAYVETVAENGEMYWLQNFNADFYTTVSKENYNSADAAGYITTADGTVLEALDKADGNVSGGCVITDERFAGVSAYPVMLDSDNKFGYAVLIDGHEWYFYHSETEQTYYIHSLLGKDIKARDSETVEWLYEHGRFASGRGYLWAKTIPLIKKHILLGSGADTFVLVYPNADLVSMYNTGYEGLIITKPHNMYLQMAVQTGLVSVIAFLVFYLWFFIYALGTCFKMRKYDFKAFVGTGILCGTAGYMVVQIINDSSMSVAPLYWVLMGVGISIFKSIRENETFGEEQV